MGTWSHEPFGNDAANDWAYELESKSDFSLVEAALDRVLEAGDGYVDADAAEEAIAAIEVLAKALGRGTQSDAYTRKVDIWLASLSVKPEPVLMSKAQKVLKRILSEDSELKELWEDSEEFAEWSANAEALLAAVGA